MSDIELDKAQYAIRAVIAKADPAPVREMSIVKQLHLDTATVRRVLDGLAAAGEIVSCTLFADGVQQMEVKLATAAGGPAKFSQQFISLSSRSAADNKRRAEQLNAEHKGLLRIPGSAGPRTAPRRLDNLAAIGPADPPAPRTAEPSAHHRTTTQETRSMGKPTGAAETVRAALTDQPQNVDQLIAKTGMERIQLTNALQRLRDASRATRAAGRGTWIAAGAPADTSKVASAPLVKPAAEKKAAPKKPAKPSKSKARARASVGSLELKVELDTTDAIAKIGHLKDLAASPVNILKLEGGDLLVLRGNIVKAQLDPAEVDALRKAA